MGLFDQLKDMAGAVEKAVAEHPEQTKGALAKLGAFVETQAGGGHHDQVASALKKADDYIDAHSAKTPDEAAPTAAQPAATPQETAPAPDGTTA